MDVNEYIESGILELYVAGALSEKENKEVYEQILEHPEILDEVLKIERTVVKLTATLSPHRAEFSFSRLQEKLKLDGGEENVISVNGEKRNWWTYTRWAATVLLAIGLFWVINRNKALENKLADAENKQILLEQQIVQSDINLKAEKTLLSILRDRNITTIPLTGQGNFSNTYAKVYWDKKTKNIYLDAQGLPEPPEGKVYQMWSLTLEPLTPTSLGVIENFRQDDDKIFEIANSNQSEAFGITLEPTGGSESPTMEQLYTLGIVDS